MSIAIKSIPILTGNEAKLFIKKADDNLSKIGSVDFSKQIRDARLILEKANI